MQKLQKGFILMSEKSIKKNAFWAFLRAFMTSFFPLITFPYASRVILPEGIGQVNFSNSIVNYFIMLAGLGIGTYGIRECAKRRNNKIELSKFVKEILTINICSTLVSYVLFFLVIFLVPKTYPYRSLLLVSCTNILFITVGLEWLYKGIEEFKYITVRNFIFQCIGLVYLFVFVRTPEDCEHYVIFGLITSVGSNICNIFHSRKFISYSLKCKLEIKKHIKPIFTFFGMSVVSSIYEMLDTTLLGFLSDNLNIGYYSAANKLNMTFLRLITASTAVILPRLTYYNQNRNEDEYKTLTTKIFYIVLFFTVPVSFGLYALSSPLVMLFSGESFIPAVSVMHILAPLIVVMSISDITGVQILPSIGKEKVSLISYIVGAVCNIILNIILIPRKGALGAAIGSLIAESTVMLIQVIYLKKYFASKSLFINFFEILFASVIMFICIKFELHFISNIILQILLAFISGILVYYLILLCLRNDLLMEIQKSLYRKIRNNK